MLYPTPAPRMEVYKCESVRHFAFIWIEALVNLEANKQYPTPV